MNVIEKRVLSFVQRGGPISTSMVANKMKCSPEQAAIVLSDLENAGSVSEVVTDKIYNGEQVSKWSAT